MNITKGQIVELLRAWIKQRPGLEFCNYGDVSSYRSEMSRITQQKHDAERLLNAVEFSSIDAPALLDAFGAFSGRLQVKETDSGEYRLEYCAGQYWPTEYRASACAVLASALWDYHRPTYKDEERAGDKLRAAFRRMFGASIQKRWFD